MINRLLITLCMPLLLFSCKKNTEAVTRNLPAETIANIAYGIDPLQQMDIYLPEGRSTTTTGILVLIHGGSWTGGDKSEFVLAMPMVKEYFPEYAIFNINYRLVSGSNNLSPTQQNDVKAAIEFIAEKKAAFAVSDKLVLVGASAGGHLALLQGYKNLSPLKAKAVVDFFGPTDLIALYNLGGLFPSMLTTVTGESPETNPSIYNQSSPVNFVNAGSPPTILLHGGKDATIPPAQSEILVTRLQENKVNYQLVLYPNQGHGWIGPDLEDSFSKIAAFLKLHVK